MSPRSSHSTGSRPPTSQFHPSHGRSALRVSTMEVIDKTEQKLKSAQRSKGGGGGSTIGTAPTKEEHVDWRADAGKLRSFKRSGRTRHDPELMVATVKTDDGVTGQGTERNRERTSTPRGRSDEFSCRAQVPGGSLDRHDRERWRRPGQALAQQCTDEGR